MLRPDEQRRVRAHLHAREPGRARRWRHVMACALDAFEGLGLEAPDQRHPRRADSTSADLPSPGGADGLVAALFFAALDDRQRSSSRRSRRGLHAQVVEASVRAISLVSAQPASALMFRARAAIATRAVGGCARQPRKTLPRAVPVAGEGRRGRLSRLLPRGPDAAADRSVDYAARGSLSAKAPPSEHHDLTDAAWRSLAAWARDRGARGSAAITPCGAGVRSSHGAACRPRSRRPSASSGSQRLASPTPIRRIDG